MTYNYFVLEPLEQAIDDTELPELSEEDMQPIFIPFPLTTREIRQPLYRGSDPEWQEFIKFSKQDDLVQQVRRWWMPIFSIKITDYLQTISLC